MSIIAYIPNFLSWIRLLLAPCLIMALATSRNKRALLLLFLGACTDAADGWIARKYQAFSPLGILLDPLADKVFFGAMVIGLGLQGLLSSSLTWALIVRDILIVGIGTYLRFLQCPISLAPHILGKIHTACLACYGVFVLMSHVFLFAFTGKQLEPILWTSLILSTIFYGLRIIHALPTMR